MTFRFVVEMHQFISILLSGLIFLQSIHLKPSDVMNLDAFISHALDHARQGNDFFEFLTLHYGNKTEQHLPQDSEHKHLPFHGNYDMNASNLVLQPVVRYCQLSMIHVDLSYDAVFYYINFYSFLDSNTLIQPPIR